METFDTRSTGGGGRPRNDESCGRLANVARPLETARDLDPLLDRVGDARFVLLGEASHGTSEYYTWRTAISQRLIREEGFSFIAVEGDWPDCYRVNRYVKGLPDAGDSARGRAARLRALADLDVGQRGNRRAWPSGCGATTTDLPERAKVGFYGLDVYSLWDSLYRSSTTCSGSTRSALPAARRPSAASSRTARTCKSTRGRRPSCPTRARTRWSTC